MGFILFFLQKTTTKTGSSLSKPIYPGYGLVYRKTHRTQQDTSLTLGELLKHLCPLLFTKQRTMSMYAGSLLQAFY